MVQSLGLRRFFALRSPPAYNIRRQAGGACAGGLRGSSRPCDVPDFSPAPRLRRRCGPSRARGLVRKGPNQGGPWENLGSEKLILSRQPSGSSFPPPGGSNASAAQIHAVPRAWVPYCRKLRRNLGRKASGNPWGPSALSRHRLNAITRKSDS